MQCSKKVSEKNELDPTKGTTVILNELLADEVWLAEVSIITSHNTNVETEYILIISVFTINCSFSKMFVVHGPRWIKLKGNIVVLHKMMEPHLSASHIIKISINFKRLNAIHAISCKLSHPIDE